MTNLPRLALAASTAACSFVWAAPALAEDADGVAPTIVVEGHHDEGYRSEDASATKTGTPLIDTPQSVTTISREQLDDQAVEQLNDALRYVPGVSLGQGEGHRDQIVLRGQSSTADFFLDGLRDDAQYYRPLYNTERVEVLKGANALLFGRGGGGGVINRVSKAPLFDQTRRSVSAGVDTFGAWSLSADVGQSLSDNVAVRLNGIYEEFNNHRDGYEGHFAGVAPTLGVKLGERTSLVLAYEYVEDRRVTERGIPATPGGTIAAPAAPISGHDRTFFGDPDINRSEVTAHIARARIDHELSDSLSFNLTGQFATYDKFYGNILPGAVNAAATQVSLSGYESGTWRDNYIGQGNLVWKGDTGGIGHTILAGFEASSQITDSTRRNAQFGAATSVLVPLARPIVVPAVSWTALGTNSHSSVRSLSAYVQDQIELGEHVQLVAGLRYDDFEISTLNRLTSTTGARHDGKWSPRVGLIVKPRENLSIYASYAKSFLPQSGDQFSSIAANTATLDPEAFESGEIGLKWNLTPDLTLTGAVFQVYRSNTRVADPANPGFFVLTGKSRTRGFEASLAGRITPEWQASLGYTYQEGEIVSSTSAAPAGRKLDKLPNHQFSAWTRYNVSSRLGFGLGLIHQSSQFATISNAVRLPAFTRLDAAVYYDFTDAFSLQLNVENVTDTAYYPSAHTDNNISMGEPLNARLTARVKF